MKRIVYASGNQNKIKEMRRWLSGYAVEVCSPKQLGLTLHVAETADSACGNALLKAEACYLQCGLGCLGEDSAFEFLDLDPQDPDQPGLYVRRLDGEHEMSDDEMLKHYVSIVKRHGGPLTAVYRDGWSCVNERGETAVFQIQDRDILRASGFLLTDKIHPVRHPGWPLDSISIDPETGRYFTENPPDLMTLQYTETMRLRDLGLMETIQFIAESLELEHKKAV